MRDVTDALNILLAPPAPGLLTVRQRAGNVCLWCPKPIPPGKGVPLGGFLGWTPQACTSCHEAQSAALATYLDWNDHAQQCAPCRTTPCKRSLIMRYATMRAWERAGWPAARCTACLNPIRRGEPCHPHVWEGASRPVLSILHTSPCPTPPHGPTGYLAAPTAGGGA